MTYANRGVAYRERSAEKRGGGGKAQLVQKKASEKNKHVYREKFNGTCTDSFARDVGEINQKESVLSPRVKQRINIQMINGSVEDGGARGARSCHNYWKTRVLGGWQTRVLFPTSVSHVASWENTERAKGGEGAAKIYCAYLKVIKLAVCNSNYFPSYRVPSYFKASSKYNHVLGKYFTVLGIVCMRALCLFVVRKSSHNHSLFKRQNMINRTLCSDATDLSAFHTALLFRSCYVFQF